MRSLFALDRAEASRNMACMFVTPEVSKLSGWLKADAERNMALMLVTLDVSKLSGWLKADAPENISLMSVTLDVSQLDMSALNWSKSWKSWCMFVTAVTPQLGMGPYVAVAESASALYSRAAVFRASKSVKAWGDSSSDDGSGWSGSGLPSCLPPWSCRLPVLPGSQDGGTIRRSALMRAHLVRMRAAGD
jgi:hypothetical protein